MLLQMKEALQFVYEEKKLNDLSFFLFFCWQCPPATAIFTFPLRHPVGHSQVATTGSVSVRYRMFQSSRMEFLYQRTI